MERREMTLYPYPFLMVLHHVPQDAIVAAGAAGPHASAPVEVFSSLHLLKI